jgi:pyruvate formate lyase activating enzyme
MPTLRDVVYENVREGELYEKLDRNRVRCFACGHCCPILDGQPGVCKVRYNRGGTLYIPWGYVGVVQCDPIEKNPSFTHILGRWPTALECSAVICTVPTVRIG